MSKRKRQPETPTCKSTKKQLIELAEIENVSVSKSANKPRILAQLRTSLNLDSEGIDTSIDKYNRWDETRTLFERPKNAFDLVETDPVFSQTEIMHNPKGAGWLYLPLKPAFQSKRGKKFYTETRASYDANLLPKKPGHYTAVIERVSAAECVCHWTHDRSNETVTIPMTLSDRYVSVFEYDRFALRFTPDRSKQFLEETFPTVLADIVRSYHRCAIGGGELLIVAQTPSFVASL